MFMIKMTTFDAYPLLKISHSAVLNLFLHGCVDELIGKSQPNFDNCNSDIEWTPEDKKKARKCIQDFYRRCAKNNEFILTADGINDNLYDAIKNCYDIRKNDIIHAVIKENIMTTGHNLAENIDWKLKWVLGSSKLATLREVLLQVDLHCVQDEKNIQKRNTVNFESNLATLDALIENLETVKSELYNE